MLNTLDAASVALTVCDVAANVGVIAPRADRVGAMLVIDGTMYLHRDGRRQMVRAGEMAMIPARDQVSIATSARATGVPVDSRDRLVKRGNWLVSDATEGDRRVLRVAMVKIAGTKAEWLPRPTVLPLTAGDSGARLFDLLREQFDRNDAGAPALALSLVSACIIQALKTSIHDEDPRAAEPEARSPSLARGARCIAGASRRAVHHRHAGRRRGHEPVHLNPTTHQVRTCQQRETSPRRRAITASDSTPAPTDCCRVCPAQHEGFG